MTGFLGYPIGNSAKVDVQKFGPDFNNGSKAGVNVWNKPILFTPKLVVVYLCGGGGGGGSGRKGASTNNAGGGGGTGAELVCAYFDPFNISDQVIVSIGSGGSGGSSQTTDSTNGNLGSDGTASTFGSYITARPGLRNTASAGTGTVSAMTLPASGNRPGGSSGGLATTGSTGGSTSFANAAVGVMGYVQPIGGAGGGGISASAAFDGGSGVPTNSFVTSPVSNAGVSGASGGNAVSLSSGLIIPQYSGGGGGSGSRSVDAGAGGVGKFGSGGGGGGASLNAISNSGAGGAGGGGFCVIVAYG
jgi:hypothetical protein